MARLWRKGKQKVSFALKRALKKRAMVSRDISNSLQSLTKKNLLFMSSFYFVALRATTTSFLTANLRSKKATYLCHTIYVVHFSLIYACVIIQSVKEKMEEEKYVPASSMRYGARIMSPEIVEIGEDIKTITNSIDGVSHDVYVAVGKNDTDVLKWALDHAVLPGARVFLVHVFPPLTYIPTPVGRLSRSQLSQDQMRFYINEENNRRRNHLQKYISLCADAKVTVDTMLLESNSTAKAILELIPVLNIRLLVMGTKRLPRSRLLRKKLAKGEVVKKNAPDYCEVSIIHESKKILDGQPVSSCPQRPDAIRNSEKKFFELACFSGKLK